MKIKRLVKEAELIVFDLDGTILNSLKTMLLSFQKALLSFNYKYSLFQIKKELGPKGFVVLSKLMKKAALPEIKKANRMFSKNILTHINEIKAFKDVTAAVKTLSTYKKLALLTNSNKKYADRILSKLKLNCYFKKAVYGDSGFKDKAEGLKHMIKSFKVSPKKIIYIGDAVSDARAAKKAGCKSIAIIRWFPIRDIKKEKPDYIIRSMKELF